MSVPWVNGTVEAVAEDLRKTRQMSPHDSGLIYAAAMGMVIGLANNYYPSRPCEERMADILTVCKALRLIEEEPV